MPLNISGSVITSDSADTLDQRSIVTSDLVHHYDAESPDCYAKAGSTTVKDISGTLPNTGTMYTGTALEFDGSNDYVTIGAISNPPRASGTISCWVNPASTSSPVVGTFLDSQGGWFVLQRVGSSINFVAGYSGSAPYATNLGSIGANTWSHVCGTFNAQGDSDIRIYINGKQVGSTYSAAGIIQGNLFKIASTGGTGAGKICDMRVYNIGLTSSQVAEIYRNPGTPIPAGAVPTDLVGWWPLMEGSGTTAWDCSGNENHGTLTNMDPATDWVGGQVGSPQLAGKGHSTKMMFAPNDDKVDFGDLGFSNSVSAISVSMWIKPNTITADDGGWEFWPASGSVREFSLGVYNSNYHTKIDGDFYNYAAGPAKKWTHVIITYDGSYHRLYKNGILVASNAHTSHPDLDGASFVVGTYDTGNYYADGTFDEMAVWDVALGIDDIITLANKSNGKPNPPDARSVVGESLVGYWRNDGLGKWKDLSGNNNDGTVSGSPSRISFPRGIDENRDSQGFFSQIGSFTFDGSNNYISVPSISTGASHTVMCWTRMNVSTGGDNYKIHWDNNSDYIFGIKNDKINHYTYQSDMSYSDTTLIAGQWYHIALARSSSSATFYLNGAIDGVVSVGSRSMSGTYTIGRRASGSYPYNGSIGNLKIYNRELSSTEIQHNYNVQRDRFGV